MTTGPKLSNLPTALQSEILVSLSPTHRAQKIPITLSSAKLPTQPLPSDLLAVAETSTQLAEATADALRDRAKYLTANVAKAALPAWVSALRHAVKAVSTYDAELARLENLGSLSYKDQAFFDELCRQAINLFKALSEERVALEVLDVKSVRFAKSQDLEEELSTSLLRALERSGPSLRELALPVTDLCAKVLAKISLPALDVVELLLRDVDGVHIIEAQKGRSSEVFLQFLRALDGHADREHMVTTLRELRMGPVNEPPCIDVEQSGCSPAFFDAIRTLRLRALNWSKHDNDPIARFISLFPKLECLHWNGVVTPKHLQMINTACPNLKELHLSPYARYTPEANSHIVDGDIETLGEVFIASQGKLKTLLLIGKLTTEQMKVLGENSPALECFSMEIGGDNVGGLGLLLGTHCREMKKLELQFVPESDECLGAEGWQTFADAVKSASEELCDLAIQTDDERYPTESAMEEMVRSILDILEFLGERARSVVVHVPMETADQRILVDALCRIMCTCAAQNKCLECLEVSFIVADVDYTWDSEEMEKEMFEKLLKEKKKLLEAVPRLTHTYFGGVDDTAEERLEEMDE